MALHLKLKPHFHHYPIPSLRPLSSSPLPHPPRPPPSDESPPESQPQPSSSSYFSDAKQHLGNATDSPNPTNSQPSFSSYFSDIKQRLGSPSSPPRRIPIDPAPPPSLFPPKSPTPNVSFDEIRKHLASFRSGAASTTSPPSSSPPISFQELFKKDLQNNPPGSAPVNSFDAIRQSLRQSRGSDAFSIKSLKESIRSQEPQTGTPHAPFLIGSDGPLPESVFGREAMEKKGAEGEGEGVGLKTEFLKSYTYQELGEKLLRLRLRPREEETKKKKKKKEGFSLTELNQRLLKLRELEEEEAESRDGHFSVISETLRKIQEEEDRKTASKSKCLFFGC